MKPQSLNPKENAVDNLGFFQELPVEIILHIFDLMPWQEANRLNLVCAYFYYLNELRCRHLLKKFNKVDIETEYTGYQNENSIVYKKFRSIRQDNNAIKELPEVFWDSAPPVVNFFGATIVTGPVKVPDLTITMINFYKQHFESAHLGDIEAAIKILQVCKKCENGSFVPYAIFNLVNIKEFYSNSDFVQNLFAVIDLSFNISFNRSRMMELISFLTAIYFALKNESLNTEIKNRIKEKLKLFFKFYPTLSLQIFSSLKKLELITISDYENLALRFINLIDKIKNYMGIEFNILGTLNREEINIIFKAMHEGKDYWRWFPYIDSFQLTDENNLAVRVNQIAGKYNHFINSISPRLRTLICLIVAPALDLRVSDDIRNYLQSSKATDFSLIEFHEMTKPYIFDFLKNRIDLQLRNDFYMATKRVLLGFSTASLMGYASGLEMSSQLIYPIMLGVGAYQFLSRKKEREQVLETFANFSTEDFLVVIEKGGSFQEIDVQRFVLFGNKEQQSRVGWAEFTKPNKF